MISIKRITFMRDRPTNRHLLRFLLFIFLILPSSLQATIARYALVIGNSRYQYLNPLDNPKRDAISVAAKLQDLGFSLLDAEGHAMRTPGPVLDLDMAQFTYAVQLFAQQARGAEIAFIYYAGHGMQLNGRSQLLPVDTPLPDIRRDKRLSILSRYAQPLDAILEDLDGQARLTVAVFDACREIPKLDEALRGLSRSTGIGVDSFRGLSRLTRRGRSRIVAYSGGSGQLVADGTGNNHSPYTATLLEHLGAKNKPVESVFLTVAHEFGKKYGGQNPEVLIQGVEPGRFYLRDSGHASISAPDPVPHMEPQTRERFYSQTQNLNPRGDNFLSMRSGPGTKYREIHRIYNNGTQVEILERSGKWYKVHYQGRIGWSYGHYLTTPIAF